MCMSARVNASVCANCVVPFFCVSINVQLSSNRHCSALNCHCEALILLFVTIHNK